MSRIHWTIDGLVSGADYANSDIFENVEEPDDDLELVAHLH